MDGGVLHDIFEDAAARWPDRIAIDVPPSPRRPDRRAVTYRELDRQSNGVARALCPRVAEPDGIVVVLLPRASEHLYVAQLAALKAGAAFTCIDPAFPDGQIQTILDDARAIAVLTDATGTARLAELRCGAPVVDVPGSIMELPAVLPSVPRPAWLSPSSLAYLIYTSGTTGVPKGVMVEHRSIVNLVRGDMVTLGVTVDDRVAQHSSPAYDSSIEETWFALAVGATVVVMDDEAARLGPDLAAWLRDEHITMFCPPPTLLRSAGCVDPERELPELRLLHPGGEALPQDVADTWGVGRRLVNDYGPTEATITAIRGVVQSGQPVSIGCPVPGMEAWVVDEQLQEVPEGGPGELCLGGIGLARGYRNAPELTAQKFQEHPRFGRIYRTGDLATRGADGRFQVHGRIDTQVKIRGYRIELEAIETRLVEVVGVREAACTVQGDGSRTTLVAFAVFEPGLDPPTFDEVKRCLRDVLPEYMVPSRLGALSQLPRSTSGKLDRRALPLLRDDAPVTGVADVPRTAIESRIADTMQQVLGLAAPPPIDVDFFTDLGGDSLAAAMAVSLLRQDTDTQVLAVRDLYEARTVARLAARVDARVVDPRRSVAVLARDAPRRVGRPALATLAQAAWLLLGIGVAAPLGYVVSFQLLPGVLHRIGLANLLLVLPLIYAGGLLAYAVTTAALAVALKRLLIGTYRPLREPVWSSFYVRNWMVQRSVRLVPWRLIEATVFQNVVLRALGARIGNRVHIHRGVTLLQGGWDLLDIGDDVAIGQDAALQLVSLEDGQIVVGPVTLGDGASLDVRAGVGSNGCVGANAMLSAWSYLPSGGRVPDGERWDGVPAGPAGPALAPPVADRLGDLSPMAHGAAMILGRIALGAFVMLPVQLLALAGALAIGIDAATAVDWLLHPTANRAAWGVEMALVVAAVPLTLVFEVFAMRILGRARPGVISLWSPAYLRMRLKTEILESAGRWLCSTLLWPVWLRAVGMRVGRGSEVGSIIDTVPELVEIGSDSFFADGIHFAGPTVSRGTVTLAPVSVGNGVFLGNHAVVGCGQTVPDGVLVGVCTVADSTLMTRGTSWFGHPPFELFNREPVTYDRSLTHEPSRLRYLNRLCWELLRFAVPLGPVGVALAWFGMLGWAAEQVSMPVLLFAVLPGLELMVLAMPLLLVLGLKWLLLGRVRPGTHALWSCWVSRWDFLYVAWDICATAGLAAIEGSLLLNAYLRAMGVKLGRHVVLGPGFVQVADPDLLHFEDGATVTSLNQAHTFEDRVLKMDVVRVRRHATVGHVALMLYGADIGEKAYVMPHSVVMKRERLLPSQSYAGCPTRAL